MIPNADDWIETRPAPPWAAQAADPRSILTFNTALASATLGRLGEHGGGSGRFTLSTAPLGTPSRQVRTVSGDDTREAVNAAIMGLAVASGDAAPVLASINDVDPTTNTVRALRHVELTFRRRPGETSEGYTARTRRPYDLLRSTALSPTFISTTDDATTYLFTLADEQRPARPGQPRACNEGLETIAAVERELRTTFDADTIPGFRNAVSLPGIGRIGGDGQARDFCALTEVEDAGFLHLHGGWDSDMRRLLAGILRAEAESRLDDRPAGRCRGYHPPVIDGRAA